MFPKERHNSTAWPIRLSGRKKFLQTLPATPRVSSGENAWTKEEVHGEVKCILEIRQVIERHVSAPFIAATPEQRAEFIRLIEELELFRGRP